MNMNVQMRWPARYLLAAAAIVASVLLRFALVPVLGYGAPLYIVLSPAIVIVAVLLGIGPGLFGALLGVVLVELFFVDPPHRFSLSAALAVRWGISLLSGFVLGWIGQRLRSSHAQVKAHVEAARVAEQTMGQTMDELAASRRAALNLMEDAIAARERAEQINLKLHLLQEKEKADAIRLARAQSAANTLRAMHEGVLLLELDGTILFVNPAVEQVTGLAGRDIVGRNLASLLLTFLRGDDLQQAQHGLGLLRLGQTQEYATMLLRRPDGTSYHILPSVSVMDAQEEDGGRRLAVLTLKDVSELHKASRQLEDSERKYRELVENANSIIMRITPEHNITFFNEYAQKFFGFTSAEVLGRNLIGTIVPAVDSSGHDSRLLLQAIAADPELYASNENEYVCKSGQRVWVHWANRAVRDGQGKVLELLCVGADVTQRRTLEDAARRYQERLSALAERLAVTEEEDRWRISRNIHDTVIQSLSLANIRLGAIAKPLHEANLMDEARALGLARELLNHAIDECRMVMSDLTPALLYELGLVPALQELAQRLGTLHGVRIEVAEEGAITSMKNSMRGLLFESVRELITNALKHSGSSEIRVAVRCSDASLVITVADDGKGFDTSVVGVPSAHHGGFGLFSIRQRLDGLWGRLEFISAPGKGTVATIHVPLN